MLSSSSCQSSCQSSSVVVGRRRRSSCPSSCQLSCRQSSSVVVSVFVSVASVVSVVVSRRVSHRQSCQSSSVVVSVVVSIVVSRRHTVCQIHFKVSIFEFGGFFGSNFCVFGPIDLILALFDHIYLQFDDSEGILEKNLKIPKVRAKKPGSSLSF